jgi:hypothetical protein
MIITIDTETKILKVSGKVTCKELVYELDKLLKEGLSSYTVDARFIDPATIKVGTTSPWNSNNNFTSTNEGIIPPIIY